MKKINYILSLCLAFLLVGCHSSDNQELKPISPDKEIDESDSKPSKDYVDFIGQSLDQETSYLSNYIEEGKYTLLAFWAPWCRYCLKEMKELNEIYDKYKEQDFALVGIVLEGNIDTIKQTIHKYGIEWPQLVDGSRISTSKDHYNFNSIPYLVLLEKDGTISDKKPIKGKLDSWIQELLK